MPTAVRSTISNVKGKRNLKVFQSQSIPGESVIMIGLKLYKTKFDMSAMTVNVYQTVDVSYLNLLYMGVFDLSSIMDAQIIDN